MTILRLRDWQTECLSKAIAVYESGDQSHFFVKAAPGSGKTALATFIVEHLMNAGMIDYVLVFSPNPRINQSFADDLLKFSGVSCDKESPLSRGRCYTYSWLARNYKNLEHFLDNGRFLCIFDEAHHIAGKIDVRGNASGNAIIQCQVENKNVFTLSLSGTPWRSDSLPITLCKYDQETGLSIPDFEYSEDHAIRDEVCRKPVFTAIDARITIHSSVGTKSFECISSSLKDTQIKLSDICNEPSYAKFLLMHANRHLKECKKYMSNAGGLIVSNSICSAYEHKKLIEEITGREAAIITSLDGDSKNVIQEFKRGKKSWLVSVKQVSEGVNIPRLMVCAYLSNIQTLMNFTQVLGRIQRFDSGEKENQAKCQLIFPKTEKFWQYANLNSEVPKYIEQSTVPIRLSRIQNLEAELNYNCDEGDNYSADSPRQGVALYSSYLEPKNKPECDVLGPQISKLLLETLGFRKQTIERIVMS